MVPVYAEERPEVDSDFVLLYDLDTHQVLWDKDSNEQIYPASLTKLMTLIVGIENIEDPSIMIPITEEVMRGLADQGASMAGFVEGDVVSAMDLFYGIMLPSGAECSRAIALQVAGSNEAYVGMMNDKALELGMYSTHFENTTGLHLDNHYTTLHDLALLLDYCLANPLFYEIFSTMEHICEPTNSFPGGLLMQSTIYRFVHNEKNPYYTNIPGLVGTKTGFTYEAEYCIAALAEHEGTRYALITAHAYVNRSTPSHIIDAGRIYNYAFNTYEKKDIFHEQNAVGEVDVNYNFSHRSTLVYPESDLGVLVSKDDYEVVYHIPESVDATLVSGDVIGSAEVFSEGNQLAQINLVVREDIERNILLYLVINYPVGLISVLGISIILILLLKVLINRKVFR